MDGVGAVDGCRVETERGVVRFGATDADPEACPVGESFDTEAAVAPVTARPTEPGKARQSYPWRLFVSRPLSSSKSASCT